MTIFFMRKASAPVEPPYVFANARAQSYSDRMEAADEAASPGVGPIENAIKAEMDALFIGLEAIYGVNPTTQFGRLAMVALGALTIEGSITPLLASGLTGTVVNYVPADYDRGLGLTAAPGSGKQINISPGLGDIDSANGFILAGIGRYGPPSGAVRTFLGSANASNVLAMRRDDQSPSVLQLRYFSLNAIGPIVAIPADWTGDGRVYITARLYLRPETEVFLTPAAGGGDLSTDTARTLAPGIGTNAFAFKEPQDHTFACFIGEALGDTTTGESNGHAVRNLLETYQANVKAIVGS